jgi:hypothetical protein
MIRRKSMAVDNRDTDQVYEFMEAQIEALKRRIEELESEKLSRDQMNPAGANPANAFGFDCNPTITISPFDGAGIGPIYFRDSTTAEQF